MKSKNLLIKSLVIALALTLTNCSPKESDRKRSFADGDYETVTDQDFQSQDLTEVAKLEALLSQVEPLVMDQSNQPSAEVDGPMLLSKVITPLRDITLNAEYLMNPATRYLRTETGIQLVPRLVTIFDQAIILAYNSNPNLILKTDILAVYKDLIFWDCDQELKGSCEFIKFYRVVDSNNITRIIKLIHDQETSDVEKLRIVKAGFDLKNRRVDDSLRFMLLERIAESFSMERSGSITRERLRQDADLFANIFKINTNALDADGKYTALIKELNPWLLSRNIDDPKNPAMTDLIRLGASNLIYNGAELSDELKAVIEGLQYKIGPQFEQGVEFQKDNIRGKWKTLFVKKDDQTVEDLVSKLDEKQKELRALVINNPEVELFGDESKRILTNFLSDVQFKKDEYFFLVHQIFYGHYNIDDAAAFWAKTSKDQKRLMEAVMNIIKMQIVNNIVYTNTRMNNFYNRNENTKLIELLRESDKEGSKIRKAWTQMITRSQALKSFSNRVVTIETQDKKEQLDFIKSSVDALAKNIKFLVTYPNMFPLMHVMASLEMKDTIQGFFGTFTIDSQTVIDYFFAGRFMPLFNFGNDGIALDQTEIIYAYYYALATEIFKTYSTNKVVQFSPEDFFKVVVKKLILSNEQDLDNSRRWLSEKRTEFTNSIRAMQAACTEEKRLQAEEEEALENKMRQWVQAGNKAEDFDWVNELRSVMRPRSFANNQMSYPELGQFIYDQTSTSKGKLGHYIKNINSATIAKVFDNMRSQFQKQNTMARVLLDVYSDYNKVNQDEIKDVFEKQFEEYNRLKAEYSKLYFEVEEEIDGCEWTFIKRDRDIRHAMMFREIKFLETMFKDLDDSLLELTEKERTLLGMSEDQLNEVINSSEASTTSKEEHSNALVKKQEIESIRKKYMSPFMHSMFPQEYKDRVGYMAISGNRITTFRMDTYARVLYYMNELFRGQYSVTAPANFLTEAVYKESDARFIYFDWSEKNRELAKKKFISSGIKAFAENLNWASNAPSIDDLITKSEILVKLYKLNKISLNPEINCSDSTLDEEIVKNNCRQVTAADIIAHFKKLIDFANIDERDEIILDLLGKETKYDEAQYNQLIKKADQHELYSYYDLIFRRVISDQPVNQPEDTWFKGTLAAYANSVQKREGSTFIFKYPDSVEQIFIKNYKAWIDDYFQANLSFLREVKKQMNEGVEPFVFKYRMDRSHVVGQEGSGTLDPLISNLMYGKFVGFNQQMDNDSNRYFIETFNKYKEEVRKIVSGNE